VTDTAEHGYVFVEWALRFWDGVLSRPMSRDAAFAWAADYNRLVSPRQRAYVVQRATTAWRPVDPYTMEVL
jgi:hypothetical protein